MTQQPECDRPICSRIAHKAGRGYCLRHAEVLGIIKPFIPRDKALPVVQRQLDRGHTLWSLAKAAGLHQATLYKFMAGPESSWGADGMKQSTYEAILNAPMRLTYAPAWPSARRIQSLRAAGHSVGELQEGAGISQDVISRLSFHGPKQVAWEVQEKIFSYYRAHVADPVRPAGPKIDKRRWPLPMEWWDIDDPKERRTPVTDEQSRDRVPLDGLVLDAADWIVSEYGTMKDAATAIGVVTATVRDIMSGKAETVAREVRHRLVYMAGQAGWVPGMEVAA